MTCHDAETLISDYLDGALPDADRERVDAHCAQCADWSALLGDLRVIREAAALLVDILVRKGSSEAQTELSTKASWRLLDCLI